MALQVQLTVRSEKRRMKTERNKCEEIENKVMESNKKRQTERERGRPLLQTTAATIYMRAKPPAS